MFGAYSGRKAGIPPLRNTRWISDVGATLFPDFFAGKTEAITASRGQEIRTKCGITRTKCVRLSDLMCSAPRMPRTTRSAFTRVLDTLW
jgi:hypothetical protein